MKFVIVSPRQKYGGAIVLHSLCKNLDLLGYDSRIFYNEANTTVRGLFGTCIFLCRTIVFLLRDLKDKKIESVKGCKRKFFPFFSNDTVVIYPESVYGNPLRAKKVVRFFLYHNKYTEDQNAYGKKDLFICYRKQFNDWKLNPNGYELHTPYFDLDLYRRTNYGERHGTCYIIRKGKHREDLPKSFDGPIIDDMPEERKVEIFNSCEKCISYDTQTAYSSIAAMCGCLSIVVPEKGKGRNDYLKADDVVYGVAYGFAEDEIAHAISTANRVKELYEKQNVEGIKEVKKFVNICEEYFS